MYHLLREMADSWFMVLMFAFFIGVILFAFRPGTNATYDRLRKLPLEDDDVLVKDPSGEK